MGITERNPAAAALSSVCDTLTSYSKLIYIYAAFNKVKFVVKLVQKAEKCEGKLEDLSEKRRWI